MASTSQFYFSILRISIIQILRAVGFDRCSNKVVDILTDIFIRHLALLVSDCRRLANNAYRLDVELQDIAQSMINLKIIRPGKMIDPYDLSLENYLGMDNFMRWLKSDKFAQMKRTAVPTKEMILTITEDTENNTTTRSSTSNNINGIKPIMGAPSPYRSSRKNDFDQQETDGLLTFNHMQPDNETMNWLKYLLKSQSKIDYEEKIRFTVLSSEEFDTDSIAEEEEINNDSLILGPTPKHLMDYVPCRKRLMREMN